MAVGIARNSFLILGPRRVSYRFGIAVFALLLSCDSLQNAIAVGETRTISMHHTHTGEDIAITFKQNGRYDDEALKKLNWFLRDWRTDQPTKMDPRLFDIVWEVYREAGSREPIHGTSAQDQGRSRARDRAADLPQGRRRQPSGSDGQGLGLRPGP